jgi:hypothetical protein
MEKIFNFLIDIYSKKENQIKIFDIYLHIFRYNKETILY